MGAQTFKQISKARQEQRPRKLTVMKSDDERRQVFGWANVAVRVDGEQIVDWQEDIIDTEELEKAAQKTPAYEENRSADGGPVLFVHGRETAVSPGRPSGRRPCRWQW